MWRNEANKRENFDKSVERHVSRSTLEPVGREINNIVVSNFGEGGLISVMSELQDPNTKAEEPSQYTDSRGVTTRDARVDPHISPKRLRE